MSNLDPTLQLLSIEQMAGGLKKRRKRTLGGVVEVESYSLAWELTSEPQWSNSGDGYKGLCISVRVVDEAKRELIIEYPYPKGTNGRPLPVPQRPKVNQTMIVNSIKEAICAGWDPTSRGRAYVYYPQAA